MENVHTCSLNFNFSNCINHRLRSNKTAVTQDNYHARLLSHTIHIAHDSSQATQKSCQIKSPATDDSNVTALPLPYHTTPHRTTPHHTTSHHTIPYLRDEGILRVAKREVVPVEPLLETSNIHTIGVRPLMLHLRRVFHSLRGASV